MEHDKELKLKCIIHESIPEIQVTLVYAKRLGMCLHFCAKVHC